MDLNDRIWYRREAKEAVQLAFSVSVREMLNALGRIALSVFEVQLDGLTLASSGAHHPPSLALRPEVIGKVGPFDVLLLHDSSLGPGETTPPTPRSISRGLVRKTILEAIARAEDALRSKLIKSAYLHQMIHGMAGLHASCVLARRIVEDAVSLGAEGKSDEAQRRLAQLQEAIERMAALSESERLGAITALQYLMPEFAAGVEQPAPRHMNPMLLVAEFLEIYIEKARRRTVEIEFDVEGRSPEMPLVRVESNSFRRLLHCILSNSIKYSYQGSTRPDMPRSRTVRIWCQPKHDSGGRFCYIAFQNYGVGIDNDEIPLLGTPGFRGRHALVEAPIGTGLGLADARRILAEHGGRLEIQVDPLKDSICLTTVRCILPTASAPK